MRTTYIANGLAVSALMMASLSREAEGFSFGFSSLAELAEMETDEIKSLDSRLFPQGLFVVECTEASLGESTKEGLNPETGEPWDTLFSITHKMKVLEAYPLEKGVDPESIVNRVITSRKTFWPKSFTEEIGLLKGDYAKVLLPTAGKLGGLEGGEPGWADGAVGYVFAVKVTHSRPNREGTQFVNVNWQKTKKQEEPAEA